MWNISRDVISGHGSLHPARIPAMSLLPLYLCLLEIQATLLVDLYHLTIARMMCMQVNDVHRNLKDR